MRSEAISQEGLVNCFELAQQNWSKSEALHPLPTTLNRPLPWDTYGRKPLCRKNQAPLCGSHFPVSGVKADVAASEVWARVAVGDTGCEEKALRGKWWARV